MSEIPMPDEQVIRRILNRSELGHHWGYRGTLGDGYIFDHDTERSRIIINQGPTGPDEQEDDVWRHASISHTDRMPTYLELTVLHKAAWPDGGWSYQVFAPPSAHINIHAFALHLWGRTDGSAQLPNFGVHGSI